MKKVLVIGGKGMLGHKLVQRLTSAGFDTWTTLHGTFSDVNLLAFSITPALSRMSMSPTLIHVRRAIELAQPDVVVNAVGVIKQLPASQNVVPHFAINSIFPHRLAELADEFGFRLIHISTDCVFDGEKGNYTEDESRCASISTDRASISVRLPRKLPDVFRTSIIGRELSARAQPGRVVSFEPRRRR